MKTTASALHVFKFFYRFGFLLLAIPLEAIFKEHINAQIFLPLYISNIALCVIVVLLAVKSRYSTRILKNQSELSLSQGVFLRDKTSVQNERITLSLRKPHYLIFKSRKLFFFSGTLRRSIYVSSSFTEKCFESSKAPLHKSKFFHAFAAALGVSGVIPEALALLPLIRQGIKLADSQTREKILSFLEEESRLALDFLPQAMRLFTLFLLILWVLSTVVSVLNLLGLQFSKSKDIITTEFGVFSKVRCEFKLSQITALTLRQNLLSIPFSLRLCYLHLPIKSRYSRLPIALDKNKNALAEILKTLGFSPFQKPKLSLKPQSLWGYTYPQMLSLVLLSLCSIFWFILPCRKLHSALLLPLVFIMIFWFLLRFESFKRAELALCEGQIILRSFHTLSLHETHIPLTKIVGIKLSQSPFQRLFCRCSLRIYLKSPKTLSYKISHINAKKAAQLLSLCGQSNIQSSV